MKTCSSRAIDEAFLEPKVVYGYFPVQSDGRRSDRLSHRRISRLHVHPRHDRRNSETAGQPREWLRFTFPRQEGRRRLCISDFFRNGDRDEFDVLGVQLVTVGDSASELAEKFCARPTSIRIICTSTASASNRAEALAELWHKRMRQELGFGSEDRRNIREMFQQKLSRQPLQLWLSGLPESGRPPR